jgi:hypothetical protein
MNERNSDLRGYPASKLVEIREPGGTVDGA